MTSILHLGVFELPYSDAKGLTTGDVAEILEDHYHIFEIFYELHQSEIHESVVNSLDGTLESMMLGAPARDDPFSGATSTISTLFKKFIEQEEMGKIGYPGVPTKAALQGYNPRLKSKHGPRRPSFRATGLYESSATAWVTSDE